MLVWFFELALCLWWVELWVYRVLLFFGSLLAGSFDPSVRWYLEFVGCRLWLILD